MSSFFVTGTNRGLGLAITKYLVSLPASKVSTVFATARSESAELKEVIASSSSRAVFVKLETTVEESVKEAVSQVEKALGGKGLDVLINNAGACAWPPQWTEKLTDLNELFNINVTGTHMVTTYFLPLLRKAELKKVGNTTSTLSSITLAQTVAEWPLLSYKVSKTAMNALTVQYALELQKEGFVFIAMNPGWVQAGMGDAAADITAAEAAKATIDLLFAVGEKDNGTHRMLHVPGKENNVGVNQYEGGIRPW
jgi:NAD(P)-dependent dehydrogenase (short-subunit alcohol dehydrogenase family)